MCDELFGLQWLARIVRGSLIAEDEEAIEGPALEGMVISGKVIVTIHCHHEDSGPTI